MRRLSLAAVFAAFLVSAGCSSSTPANLFSDTESHSFSTDSIQLVVHVSVDGLRQDAVTKWLDNLPAYRRLREQGAFTLNARTAPTRGNTLPNHTSQLTGRVVAGPDGHGWAGNRYANPAVTIHSNKGSYVASVFDVAHENGLRTALFTSKSKFAVFANSYPEAIDAYVYKRDATGLTTRFVDSLRTGTFGYAFLHLRNPDTAGHRFGWRLLTWHPYGKAIFNTNRQIARVLKAIDDDPKLHGRTAVILTADHGGHRFNHGADHPLDYTIPFYVWGPGLPAADLYDLAGDRRADPGGEQIPDSAAAQPIRNGEAANVALALLGLDPVPGSTIGATQPLLQLGTLPAADSTTSSR